MKCGLSPLNSPVVTCTWVAPETRLEPAQARAVFALRAHIAAEKRHLSVGRWGRRDLVVKPARGHFSIVPRVGTPGKFGWLGHSWAKHINCGLTWCHKCHFDGFHHSLLHSLYNSSLAPHAWAAAAEQNSQSPQQGFTFSSQNVDINPSCPPDAAPDGSRCLMGLVPEMKAHQQLLWECLRQHQSLGMAGLCPR